MKNISEENKTWLEKDDNLKFAQYFINLGNDTFEKKIREKSIDIAASWCRLFELGKEKFSLPDELKPFLTKLIKKELKNQFETEDHIWFEMCANAAQYSFAQIDDFILTKALYGIFRILLPEEQDIEPYDKQILDALIKATNTDFEKTKQFGFAIKSNGLNSKVIFLPEYANTWVEYGDQFRLIILNINQ